MTNQQHSRTPWALAITRTNIMVSEKAGDRLSHEREQELATQIQQRKDEFLIASTAHPELWLDALADIQGGHINLVRTVFKGVDREQAQQLAQVFEAAITKAFSGNPDPLTEIIDLYQVRPSFARSLAGRQTTQGHWNGVGHDVKKAFDLWRSTINVLVEHNMLLAAKVVSHLIGDDAQKEEWVSEANLHLIKAAEAFEPGKASFVTVAYWWIYPELGRAINAPTHDSFEDEFGDQSPHELFGNKNRSSNDGVEMMLDAEKVRKVMDDHLDTRSKEVIESILAMDGRKEKKACEVAQDLGVSNARVSHLKTRAFRKIQQQLVEA